MKLKSEYPNPCRRHNGNCAYGVGDPTRCDYCHRTVAKIESCNCPDCRGGFAAHVLRHVEEDEKWRQQNEIKRIRATLRGVVTP